MTSEHPAVRRIRDNTQEPTRMRREGQDPANVYVGYEDEVRAMRLAEGRCGDCGAFDGPTHRCPWIKAPESDLKRHGPDCVAYGVGDTCWCNGTEGKYL